MDLQVCLEYEIPGPGADFLFNVQAAYTQRQLVTCERLLLNPPIEPDYYTDPITGNRCMRLHVPSGELKLDYSAIVDLDHRRVDPATLEEVSVQHLPTGLIEYLYPSRYCQSDRLFNFASSEFGPLPQGYHRVQAIRNWVNRHVAFSPNTTNSNTSAIDTLIERVGVCRDFAHLMIALCRAVNVPARFVTGTDFGADPGFGPPNFHAYVEVYLGNGWYIFDPSGLAIPMGLVRIGTGRDAADVAFATTFGQIVSFSPMIRCSAVVDQSQGLFTPTHCSEALSTDSGLPIVV
ncbi:MAG: transglutaminase family protein [Proteobacteria bacterium]|nr:transglutaminase family protein [Pseudomonadota bacterium]